MTDTANLTVRVIAWIDDLLLIGVPILVVGITLFHFEWNALLFFIVVFTLYATITPVLTSGYTLGKRIVGIRIISPDSRVSFKTIVIRHILTSTIYILSCGVALIISIAMTKYRSDKKSLHDYFARTTVVYRKQQLKQNIPAV